MRSAASGCAARPRPTSTPRSRRPWRSTTSPWSSTSPSARTRWCGRWSRPAPATTTSSPRATSGRGSPMTEPPAGLHRVGLLGGMSWASTAAYYRMLNEFVADRIGGHASAPVTIHSVDFGRIEALQRAGDWPAQGGILAEAAAALERGGVEAVALATHTLHRVSDQIVAAIAVPFVDLIDIVAAATAGYDAVGLLATGYTMSSDIYPKRLAA